MKLVLISDTHNLHDRVSLPKGDVLIHAGDLTMSGNLSELEKAASWFQDNLSKFDYIIAIAGNHDFCFEDNRAKHARDLMNDAGIIYLQDSGINISGVEFYGSPWQPWFYDWAFNSQRGEDIKKHWDAIPEGTDVLITHGPPHTILDNVYDGGTAGCEDLLNRVRIVKPKVHVFGHLHQGRGHREFAGTHFFNATVVNKDYTVVHEPFEWEV
jgi:Icc-related predicted phosphoesterase